MNWMQECFLNIEEESVLKCCCLWVKCSYIGSQWCPLASPPAVQRTVHPWCPLGRWTPSGAIHYGFSFLPECSRQHWREKKKAEALVLCVPAEVSEIDQRSAPCCCIPSWLIELSSVGNSHPPCVYTPVAPCQQLSASIRPQKQHHDARFKALITRSCMKQVRRTPSPRCARLSQTHTRSFSWLPGLFRGTKEVLKKSKWGHFVRMNWLIPVS